MTDDVHHSVSHGAPDSTAVRTALWRALHVEVDAAPPALDDTLGMRLVAPDDRWRDRPDMDPVGTAGSEHLCAGGFDPERPAVVASTGVSMYLAKDTTAAILRRLARVGDGLDGRDVVPPAHRADRGAGPAGDGDEHPR